MRERLYALQGRVFSSMGDIEKFQAADTERTENAISRLFEIIEGVQGFEKEFVGTPMGFCAVVEKFLAFAYGHRVDLEHAVWAKYPNQCPYCGKTPCMCYGRPHGRYRPKNLRMPFQNGLSLPLALSRDTRDEFADTFAWYMQLANTLGISLEGLAL